MEITKAEMASASSAAASVQELRGAEILVKALQAENVEFVWGYPGGAVLHIYDAFYKQDTIQHVLVRHEQAAVHAADGYARATGEVEPHRHRTGTDRDRVEDGDVGVAALPEQFEHMNWMNCVLHTLPLC